MVTDKTRETVVRLCVKFDNLKEQNDKEHAEIIEKLKSIEDKVSNVPVLCERIEGIERRIDTVEKTAIAGVLALIGWFGSVLLGFLSPKT